MKKLFFYFLFLFICTYNFFAFDELNFYRNNIYYGVFLLDKTEYPLKKEFSALNNIERDQVHKIMLTGMEKSRIQALNFVGDKYEFNGIELQSVLYRNDNLKYAGKKYKISDKKEKYSITFSIDDYDTIVLHTYLHFVNGKKQGIEDILNKYATIFTVKNMLAKITGEIITVYDLPNAFLIKDFENDLIPKIQNQNDKKFFIQCYKNNGKVYVLLDTVSIEKQKLLLKIYNDAYATKGFDERKRQESLNSFIEQLQTMNKEKVFEHLSKYISLNIEITDEEYDITDNFQNPANIYYSCKGDYKSVCLFYYYILSKLDYNVRAYFVQDMLPKSPYEVKFDKKETFSDTLDKKKSYSTIKSEYSQIQKIYEYEAPQIKKSIMLIALEKNENGKKTWMYTTGKKWHECNVIKPELVCSDFTKGKCFYADVSEKEYHLLHNFPINEDFVKWDVSF